MKIYCLKKGPVFSWSNSRLTQVKLWSKMHTEIPRLTIKNGFSMVGGNASKTY